MAVIDDLWIIQTTSKVKNADTDTSFSLEVQSQGQRASLRFPNLSHNERERGRTDEYHFDLRDYQFDDELFQPGEIRITTHGKDGWLPASFWIISRNKNGDYKILIANRNWPQDAWFDTDPSGYPTRPLDQK